MHDLRAVFCCFLVEGVKNVFEHSVLREIDREGHTIWLSSAIPFSATLVNNDPRGISLDLRSQDGRPCQSEFVYGCYHFCLCESN